MTTKEFIKKSLTLTAIIYTIVSAIVVITALFAGADDSGMMRVTDVKTHLFLFAFSIISAIGSSVAHLPIIPNSAKYFIEGGCMTLSFLLFVVLPRPDMTFPKACGWLIGFAIAYVLVRVVIAIIKHDEKSTGKKIKANKKAARKEAKKARTDAISDKSRKSEPEYTNLFTPDSKSK